VAAGGDLRLKMSQGELVVCEGRNRGFSTSIQEALVAGRDPSCELPLFDNSVSRRHFRIQAEGEEFWLEDLGSRNGTFVNGKRVGRIRIYHCDQIQAGESALRFISPAAFNPDQTTIEFSTTPSAPPVASVECALDSKFIEAALREEATLAQQSTPFTERLIGALRIEQEFARQTDWQELYQALARGLEWLIPSDRMALFRYHPGSRRLTPVSQPRGRDDAPGSRMLINQELLERCCAERRCIAHKEPSGRWLLVAPLEGHEHPLGAAYLEVSGRDHSGMDLVLLAAICRQAGLVLEQCELLATVRHQKLQLGELHREAAEAAQVVEVERGKLAAVLHGLIDGLVLIAEDGEVVLANPAARVSVAAACSMTPEGKIATIAGVPLAELIAKIPADAAPLFSRELDLAEHGRVYDFTIFQVPLLRGQGPGIGYGLSFRDVTARERAEEALRRSEEHLRRVQKMEAVGRLAGGVAHEFNNMLTVITGYSQLLLDRTPPEDSRRAGLEEIRRAGERAAATTRQLLAFSQRQIIQPRALDLNVVVTEAQNLIGRVLGESIQVLLRLDPAIGSVRADSGQLTHVLMSLSLNARDAMPGGGRFTVETSERELDAAAAGQIPGASPGTWIVLSVADTGVGMDQETLTHVFEPFFTTKGAGQGVGLGLATVYGIAQQSGGAVTVESAPGKGTRFLIYLPRAVASGAATTAVGSEANLPRGSETVLLVEDELLVRKLVVDVLLACGYEVLEAGSGSEAIEIFERRGKDVPHILITDVTMPQMNGRELAQYLRPSWPGMRILYMSGYADSIIAQQAIEEPGTGFLQKPFRPQVLAHQVRAVLDAQRGAS